MANAVVAKVKAMKGPGGLRHQSQIQRHAQKSKLEVICLSTRCRYDS
jgi:hypothetical protein